ncbi:hypothetical protein GE061_017901 [Apolygus lucorum]|uniref:Uncharacterized protein n=1 Tax=Apolygus lucorum TaxID=248454 RepID=A0A6A4J3V3_APOLU|nr:hypothetical protein GE061_017901 [Apolygus lucorum]
MPRRRGYEDDDRDVERGGKSEPNSAFGEDDDGFIFDKATRKDFVAKVYGLLTIQLAITFAIIFALNYVEAVREFIEDYFWVVFIFMVVQLIIYCTIVCVRRVRMSYPTNLILLTFHTLVFAGLAAWISARYDIAVIWLAFMATAVITLLVTAFAKFTPWDVTGCGMFICIAFIAVSVFSLIAFIVSFFIYIPIIHLIISGIMVALLSFYLMYMTQLILGGRKQEIDSDEVVLAVIILYTTIIDIFLHLLHLIGACMSDE